MAESLGGVVEENDLRAGKERRKHRFSKTAVLYDERVGDCTVNQYNYLHGCAGLGIAINVIVVFHGSRIKKTERCLAWC